MPALAPIGLIEPPQGFSDIDYVVGNGGPAVLESRGSGIRQRRRCAAIARAGGAAPAAAAAPAARAGASRGAAPPQAPVAAD